MRFARVGGGGGRHRHGAGGREAPPGPPLLRRGTTPHGPASRAPPSTVAASTPPPRRRGPATLAPGSDAKCDLGVFSGFELFTSYSVASERRLATAAASPRPPFPPRSSGSEGRTRGAPWRRDVDGGWVRSDVGVPDPFSKGRADVRARRPDWCDSPPLPPPIFLAGEETGGFRETPGP